MNPYDALIDACKTWHVYPCNILQTTQLKSGLDGYRKRLDDNEKRLFSSIREDIYLLELDDGDNVYQDQSVKSDDMLFKHLRQNRKDPRCRFIFIQAADSRAPLSCSRHNFLYILSFHQVPSSFLDFAFSFGDTTQPMDYHMTGFHCDDTIGAPKSDLLNIPRLGRSGCEHRMQYLLRSVERSQTFGSPATWNIRQMAVYHTYDFVTGKALWMNIKTNSVMKDRLQEATTDFPLLKSSRVGELSNSFAATLIIHLIHLEWCDEEWRYCINDVERQIRDILDKAKTARVDVQPDFTRSTVARVLTQKDLKKPTVEVAEKFPWTQSIWGFSRWLNPRRNENTAGKKGTFSSTSSSQPLKRVPEKENCDVDKQLDSLMVLDTFSFEEVQRLHHLGELLGNFRLVMALNRQTLRDIAEHYQDLPNRDGFPAEINNGCKQQLASFIRRIERIRKNLEVRTTQIDSLVSWLQDGKALFDGVLQYRNVQYGRIFTESSHVQSEKMERIAYKTEKETISMHVITCVTLAFLPGTFVAAFFQSGLMDVNKDATSLENAVTFHPTAFKLFAGICFPLMGLTFVLWVFIFRCLSRKARRRIADGVD
ncbi:hypothetical protein FZEAL_2996 [Fusarium zealandicum]|uniref:CorA-like transporter domain-containing protein n=1 Tax=Fusarium zealandicum TaxID=1053134 RepID=A0A8H4UQD5_9HYPO|nr:hypothetical protein FZEAL_2996 [Fusarium zealandicum]